MSLVAEEVLKANERYAASFGDRSALPMKPARRFAVLTCMDARLDPAKFAGIAEGEAHIIRNAGGRASDDAIRSLVISSKLLGTQEWFVVHHTDCGMLTFTNEDIRRLLKESLELNPEVNAHPAEASSEADFIEWLAFSDQGSSVVADIQRLRKHPLVSRKFPIHGYVYDVRSGRLLEVPGAKEAGAPRA